MTQVKQRTNLRHREEKIQTADTHTTAWAQLT